MDNKIKEALGDTSISIPTYSEEEKAKALETEVVILLQGDNVSGSAIYSYLKLAAKNLAPLKDKMLSGDEFSPSDFGTVLAAGMGEPSAELKSEMAVTHDLIDIPKPSSGSQGRQQSFNTSTPSHDSFWDDGEE